MSRLLSFDNAYRALRSLRVLPALLLTMVPVLASAHGGVVLEDDLCIIKVGYLEAHFKIYLPRSHGHHQFCEDLPRAGEVVFVMEYLHRGFAEAPVEFRIIRNVTGLGRFARWEDVAALGDLDAVTVFHRAAVSQPDVFTAALTLAESGEYIGVVTVPVAGSDRSYGAVFPFDVGFTGFGHWPWFMLLVALLFGLLRWVRPDSPPP